MKYIHHVCVIESTTTRPAKDHLACKGLRGNVLVEWYIELIEKYPILSAAIQFAVLGTAGEYISKKLSRSLPRFQLKMLLSKVAIWAFLGVAIKYAFVGFEGFVEALVYQGMLPRVVVQDELANAFARSLFMNLQFGPFLILIHRFLDNLASWKWSWKRIGSALMTLLWFWVPAHTVTFLLPRSYQIGLAAVWSLVLGVILAYFASGKAKPSGQ